MRDPLEKSDISITHPALRGCVVVIRAFRGDRSYEDTFAHTRDYQRVCQEAVELLRSMVKAGGDWHKVEVLGKNSPKGIETKPVWMATKEDVFPWFVSWTDDQGGTHLQRFLKKPTAQQLYKDLVAQGYLELITNSHPYKGKKRA